MRLLNGGSISTTTALVRASFLFDRSKALSFARYSITPLIDLKDYFLFSSPLRSYKRCFSLTWICTSPLSDPGNQELSRLLNGLAIEGPMGTATMLFCSVSAAELLQSTWSAAPSSALSIKRTFGLERSCTPSDQSPRSFRMLVGSTLPRESVPLLLASSTASRTEPGQPMTSKARSKVHSGEFLCGAARGYCKTM